MSATITNPILTGFNPDPSITRVGDDYYIATSTFEWFPCVQIHHSRDLVHWRLLGRPLTRASQLNMLGDPDSCGVWAPALRYFNGVFHLIYTDVKRYGRTSGGNGVSFRDMHNYLVTCPTIDGEWSDPVYLSSSGFDPSMFQDDDGRLYVVNLIWDHRPGHNRFSGIALQEYSAAERKLIGKRRNIFKGTALGLTEASHLYKRNGCYYLMTAEGGTGWGHAVTFARSRDIGGPYELHPDGPLVTARNHPEAVLQRAGHADIVETQSGETYPVGRGWLAAHRGWHGRANAGGAGTQSATTSFPRPNWPHGVRRTGPAHRFPVAALAISRGVVQPDCAPRPSATIWPGDAGQHVSPGTGRAAAAGEMLRRHHGC
jgi:xylan 1,4-beta-xylosidase